MPKKLPRPERPSLDEITGKSRQRRWQLRRVANGLCQTCGKPRKGDAQFCPKHVRARKLRYHAKKVA